MHSFDAFQSLKRVYVGCDGSQMDWEANDPNC
jgi:hypothetical protein